jgi:hypothetical protein
MAVVAVGALRCSAAAALDLAPAQWQRRHSIPGDRAAAGQQAWQQGQQQQQGPQPYRQSAAS